MNDVAITFDSTEPATSQVAGILASYISASNRTCYQIPIGANDNIIPNGKLSVIALNHSKRHSVISPKLRRQKSFITWLIDEVDWIPSNEHDDLVVGYIYSCKPNNAKCALSVCPVGCPSLDLNQDSKKEFNVALAMNGRNIAPILFIKSDIILNELTRIGIEFRLIEQLYLYLESIYSKGDKICGHDALNTAIKNNIPDLWNRLEQLKSRQRAWMNMILYWGLNEIMYRGCVIRWLDELDINYRVAGLGWEKNKRSVGYIKDENQLISFFSKARFGLHLNSLECESHRRIYEVNLSGSKCITRGSNISGSDRFNAKDFCAWMSDDINRFLECSENGYQELRPNSYPEIKPSVVGFNSKQGLQDTIEASR